MNWNEWIAGAGNRRVDLPLGILKLIAQVEHNAGIDFAGATSRVWKYLEDQGHPAPEIAAAIQASGLAVSNLKEEWNAWRKVLAGGLPEQLRPLAVPMFQLTKPLDVPLLSRSAGGDLVVGKVPFTWGVKAEASVAAEVMNAEAINKAQLGITLADGEVALQLSLHGELSANVGGKFTQTWGAIAASARAEGSAGLDLYSRQPGRRVLLAGLMESLDGFAVPGDVDQALAVPTTNDYAQMRLGLRGGFAAEGSITVGVEASRDLASLTPGGGSIGVDLCAGVKLGANFARDGAHTLVVEPQSGGLHVRVEQSTKTSFGAALELGVDIGVTGVNKAVDPILAKWLPDDAAPLAKIHGWSCHVRRRETSGEGRSLRSNGGQLFDTRKLLAQRDIGRRVPTRQRSVSSRPRRRAKVYHRYRVPNSLSLSTDSRSRLVGAPDVRALAGPRAEAHSCYGFARNGGRNRQLRQPRRRLALPRSQRGRHAFIGCAHFRIARRLPSPIRSGPA